jgi:alkylation response protein AidB-like acyl-CoA dehydrogenase
MPQYNAPLRDMQFVLHELLNVEEEVQGTAAHADTNRELVNQVLEEGGKFASQVLFPLNHSGDREGCHYDRETKSVTTPKGFKEAYKQYGGGWAALSCDPEFGGQGLPLTMNNSFYEMLNSANQAWTMYPGLSHGAYECLHAHGTDEQKQLYLPKLVSGEWTGTMCLTEPTAAPTWACCAPRPSRRPMALQDHRQQDLHLGRRTRHVRKHRAPGAGPPAGCTEGSKGISLFLVPKFLPNADGSLGDATRSSAAPSKTRWASTATPPAR